MTESDSDEPEAADTVSAEAAARYSGMWREPGDETERLVRAAGFLKMRKTSWAGCYMRGNQFAALL